MVARITFVLGPLVALVGCGTRATEDPIRLPPPNAAFDYQLGGSYEPPEGVSVLARDHTDSPVDGLYNLCYLNGFQTQPGAADSWIEEHPDLLVRDEVGQPVVDPAFPDEMIIDTSTRQQRKELLEIVGPWVDGCAADGFDAVEIDNLDTFARFPDQLSEEAAVRYARALADRAHRSGIAIGQKNAADLVGRRNETAFDFAIVEECNEYHGCEAFTDGYGDHVLFIEYDRAAFERGCASQPELTIVLRDIGLAPSGDPSYLRDAC